MRPIYCWLAIFVFAVAVKALFLLGSEVVPADSGVPCAERAVTLNAAPQKDRENTITITPPAGNCVYITGIYIKQ